ncbi:MAG: hypothetical protein HYX63_14965 [Gammaproteobacteria bacterium]|nr:hypothetical protein [Gammaproteobacteria bacterium]
MNRTKTGPGLALAAAAAAFFAAQGAFIAPAQAEEATIHCGGVNGCKGTSDCKTADNACKGQNACKGHGFKALSAEACAKAGGKAL